MKYGPYPARVLEVSDGDTVILDIDVGFGLAAIGKSLLSGKTLLSCRVYGINAPELSTPAGIAAREFAKSILPVGMIVQVMSHGWDKYGGRFDGDIRLPDGRSFGKIMIDAKMANEIS